ncbi:MAG: haloacid dehalogenase type II [Phycisphaerales bacterium]|nr:haloacid dehalogenase type II [Phycisphaerales bacterium]
MTIRWANIDAFTFDCYGTLIDWQAGIHNAINGALAQLGRAPMPDAELFRSYAEAERFEERGVWKPYREVCRNVARTLLGPSTPSALWSTLADSIKDWPAWPDTVEALRALKRRGRLVIVSNIDDELFRTTARKLDVRFDHVVTAEQVRSYKPGKAHFEEALKRLDLPAERVLHVAESRFHDIVPAQEMGFPTAWINRSGGAPAASGSADVVADLEVRNMRELVEAMERGKR